MSIVVFREKAPKEFINDFPEYPQAVQQLLYNRGLLSQSAIDSFLSPDYAEVGDPYLFKDMKKAVLRIYAAIENKETIAIHGDYDADGVGAATLLQTVLKKLGALLTVYIPHRDEGYGLNSATVEYLRSKNVSLIITCDCGISNSEAIAHGVAMGIDTIITDHHEVPEVIPPAYAIIHPKVQGEQYPFKELAGGGVAFKLAQGILRAPECPLNAHEREATEKWLLDLVCLSTIADMVVLLGENRILSAYGLKVMAKAKRLGFKYLFENASLPLNRITAEAVSFIIAPRINAAGRMDHANGSYMLLASEAVEDAQQLAEVIERQNHDRQKLMETLYSDAKKEFEGSTASIICVVRELWPIGLLGLVAGKLVKEFARPVFVMTIDKTGTVIGSGRSPGGINIIEAVAQYKKFFVSFGGHPQACGFRFKMENLDNIRASLTQYFETRYPNQDFSLSTTVEYKIGFSEITWELADYLKRFEPFGQGNPQPLFFVEDVIIEKLKAVGSKMNHLKLVLRQGDKRMPAIAFGLSGSEFFPEMSCDATLYITINEWNGSREIQLKIATLVSHEKTIHAS